jgi:uncharacterized protein (TIGR00730 family)
MSARGIHLVYGGGGAGIMGKLSQHLRRSPVKVTGIIPKRLYEMVGHLEHSEDELIVVETMHERKATMYERSDAFVALPGGIGTLEELMEAMTWLQLGYHAKPVGMLNVDGFFDPLLHMLQHMVEEGFLRQVLVDALVVEQEPRILLERLANIDLNLPGKITS